MAVVTWLAGDGNWANPSKWNSNTGLGASDDVLIAAAGGYRVSITASTDWATTAVNLDSTAIKDGTGSAVVLTGAVSNPAGMLWIDTISPRVESFTTSDPFLTNANYALTLNEPVSSIGDSDFNPVTPGVHASVSGSNGTQYIGAVDTGSGSEAPFTNTDIQNL